MFEQMGDILLREHSAGQWALIFCLYAFAGWCWEVALYLVRKRRFVNRGFLTGPILPIYGFGALTILLVCVPFRRHVWLVALLGMAAASALEYATGAAMEALFHVRYWDYSDRKWNLNGHICLLASAIWAVFSVIVVCVLHPLLHPVIARIPPLLASVLATALCSFALADAGFSVRRAMDLRAVLRTYGQEEDGAYAARVRRAKKALLRNPTAVSRRYEGSLRALRGL